MRYLDRLDLRDRSMFAHLSSVPFAVDNQYLKKDSLDLPGSAIFKILFEGTKGKES